MIRYLFIQSCFLFKNNFLLVVSNSRRLMNRYESNATCIRNVTSDGHCTAGVAPTMESL